MRDVLTYTAILGMGLPHPGIFPVSVQTPRGECLVTHTYPDNIIDESRGLKLDVTDCTVYTVTHQNWNRDVTIVGNAEAILEQALQAISEVTIWRKTKEVAGKLSPFERQVGRTDVKLFVIDDRDQFIAWKNPAFWADRRTARMAVSFMGNMIVTNGPASNPVHPVVRRVMAAIDLINLGFYTESFVSVFALTDDLTQQVVTAGMTKKGLAAKKQSLLRAIKEERLKFFLADLLLLCDWKSLEDESPELFGRLMTANKRRNDIMHGSARLDRVDTLESVDALLDVLDWLRANPFGLHIPEFPLLKLAEPVFTEIDKKVTDPETPNA